jgi:F-type H+-transporting ATPase subunit alpha
VEVLKQNESSPLKLPQQIVILFALANGHLDDIKVEEVGKFETDLHSFMESNHPEILNQIDSDKSISDESETKLNNTMKEFKSTSTY